MRGMRLDDHGTTGSQRRRRIPTRGGIGKREIAGAKNDDGTERHLQLPHIRIALVGNGRIDPRLQPVTGLTGIGIARQLEHRPRPLVPEPGLGQIRFAHRYLDEFVAGGLQLTRNSPHQIGPLFHGRAPKKGKNLPGFFHQPVYLGRRGIGKCHGINFLCG